MDEHDAYLDVAYDEDDDSGGDGDPVIPDTNLCDDSIIHEIDDTALDAARQIALLEAADGNEHGFAIVMHSDGSIGLIGPFTSGSPSYILVSDVADALGDFDGQILGLIHGHPTQVQGFLTPNADFNNLINRFLSFADTLADNALADLGYNISDVFTHYVLATDDAVRAYREGDQNIHDGSREVAECST